MGQQLGNVHPGDGAKYHGRGYIQLTGRSNYRNYGARIGINLEESPDLALDPAIAAMILCLYFKDRDICSMAIRHDWQAVRRAVNGGLNGWAEFHHYVSTLLEIIR